MEKESSTKFEKKMYLLCYLGSRVYCVVIFSVHLCYHQLKATAAHVFCSMSVDQMLNGQC